jgi:hypothetical protein
MRARLGTLRVPHVARNVGVAAERPGRAESEWRGTGAAELGRCSWRGPRCARGHAAERRIVRRTGDVYECSSLAGFGRPADAVFGGVSRRAQGSIPRSRPPPARRRETAAEAAWRSSPSGPASWCTLTAPGSRPSCVKVLVGGLARLGVDRAVAT